MNTTHAANDSTMPIPLDQATILRLIRRVVARRFEWGVGRMRRKDESHDDLEARMYRAAALAVFDYDWRDGWNLIAAEPYATFGGKQKLKPAKDVPARVVHSIMCRMKDDA